MSDSEQPAPVLESDSRFPSGPWVGYFIQWGSKSRTELDLRFSDGRISGHGVDWVGEFIVRGRYQTDDGKCWWSKRYIRGHDVSYDGYNEGKGIWGVWQLLHVQWRGGFHIWPKGLEEDATETAEEEQPAEREVVFETVPVATAS
ncbi:MAG: hypothetical protein NT069_34050 [Planctomycetota bacterium]|nr:hypothetical protein [Planctomycetota bacterium]